ncbi:uncharacterized protein LOC132062414 [Lycium ferocissimum]|uniref:uncharacterized protein LOC132062414 n=1 Tax=Lycium ferocissimum TaxID=112874 RepID=UPI0028154DFA|nr:uncharacterized protein LOC132062414 [Lycium ferocissimum]
MCFNKGDFPFTYLGCPIFHARRQKLFYKDMMKKVKDRLHAWRDSFGKLRKKEEASTGQHGKIFRTSGTLWSNFIWNKYCKRFRPNVVQWKGGSQTWKMMLQARDEMEHGIWWEPKNRSSSIWFDNWSKLGALHDLLPIHYQNEVLGDKLEELMRESQWNYAKLQEVLPAAIVDHVRMELGLFVRTDEIDKPWWILTSSGKFTVKSASEKLRKRNWISTHSLKMLVLSESAGNYGSYLHYRSFYNHNMALFFNSSRLKPLYQAIPALVLWQIWKSRNTRRHGGAVSQHKVKWNFPDRGCFKCNTDGASKGNPGPSSAAFCVRDSSGEFIYAMARILTETTNLVAEVVAIEEGITYCVLHDLLPVIVETDSLTMQKVLDGIWEVPRNIALPVRSIERWMKGKDVSVVHVFREGNCVAWFLILQLSRQQQIRITMKAGKGMQLEITLFCGVWYQPWFILPQNIDISGWEFFNVESVAASNKQEIIISFCG